MNRICFFYICESTFFRERQLKDGEIAVNYAKGSEALYIKNDKGEVKEFDKHGKRYLNIDDFSGDTNSESMVLTLTEEEITDIVANADEVILEYRGNNGETAVVGRLFKTYDNMFLGLRGYDLQHYYVAMAEGKNFQLLEAETTPIDDEISNSGLPVASSAVQEALKQKQDKLVSGTNIKTINGTSLLGSGDIQTDYTIYSSEFQGSTIRQSTYDLIKEVYESNSKHLYIRDTEPLAATKGIEACIETSMGETYTVSWHVADFMKDTRHFKYYRYRINNETLAITDDSFDSLVPFSGATSSKDGEAGAVPAPTTADTESFLCGNGKWKKIDYTVDSAMSDSSTNPVQNKVIKAYIDGLVGNVAAQLAQI